MRAERENALEILAIIERSGGGVSPEELAYKTGLEMAEVVEALDDLEREGKVTPRNWGLVRR